MLCSKSVDNIDVTCDFGFGIYRSMNGLQELHSMYVESIKDVAESSWEFDRMRARLVRLLGGDKGIEGIITYNRVMKEQTPASTRRDSKMKILKFVNHISKREKNQYP